jgi:hypothetical protein
MYQTEPESGVIRLNSLKDKVMGLVILRILGYDY